MRQGHRHPGGLYGHPGKLRPVPIRTSARLAWQVIDGQAVIMDLAASRTLGLNPAGSLIWSLLGDHDEEEIAAALADRFAVESAAALRDVRVFVEDLRSRGLVVEA